MDKIAKTQENSIAELIRKTENDYISGSTTTISKYVQISQYEILNMIDAYLNSKHISGDTDAQGREKPFFNIVTAAVNIWYRATDLDRKDIRVKATNSKQDIAAFMATVHLQNWMRRENFGRFLNLWGRTLAKYEAAVVKFVEKDGKLHPSVIPWSRLIVDPIDFDSNPVIEKLQFTPAQLRKNKAYDQDMVEKLIEAKAARTNLDKKKKDTRSEYIELYEIHGEMDEAYLNGKDNELDNYPQQMQVVTFVESKQKGEFDDFVLYKGKEAKSPYMITHLMEEDDQTIGVGAVRNLFEAQWMVNHTAKNIKDQLDLASKLIFQTSDGNFVGQNALSSIEQGDILVHAINQPLTQVANNSHDITSNQSFQGMWQSLGNQINGISEAMLGMNPRAGSAWRQTQALLAEAHSLFEVMTENKALYLEEMLRLFVIPFLKKQFDNSKEVAATLAAHDIQKIDSIFVPQEAVRQGNAMMKQTILSGKLAPQADFQALNQNVQSDLSKQGNQRFFKPSDISTATWKQAFKDLEWELEVDITGEQKDTKAVMDTLNTALKIMSSATPELLANPNFKLVFNKILEESAVISPLEIASIPPTPPPAPANRVSESISFKDLPPDGQVQMAGQAGIKISPPQVQPQIQPTQPINQPQPQQVGA